MRKLCFAIICALGFTAPLQAENRLPNADFETAGPLGSSVTNTIANPSGPGAAANWTQSLLTGTYLITRLEASADSLSGGCGNMFTIRANSPGTGSSGSTVSVNLPATVPVGSRGQMSVRVLNGAARIGFLVNLATATVFDRGDTQISVPTNVWRQITFTNQGLPSATVAIQVYAPAGQEVVIQMDHVSVTPAFVSQPSRYDYTGYFGPASSWIANFCWTNQIPVVGDFNGDGLDDIATFLRDAYPGQNGDVYVGLNTGGQFTFSGLWQGNFGVSNQIPMAADFDGDGRDDVLVFVPGTGKVLVSLSTGASFCTSREWWNTTTNGPFFFSGEIPMVGDFNGDGRTDIVTFSRLTKSVYVGLSTGTNFINAGLWQSDFCPGAGEPRVGDVNGDGKADIVCFVRNSRTAPENGRVEVALSTGTNFSYGPIRFWHQNFAVDTNYEPLLADLNGDGSKDIVAVHQDGRVFAAIKTAVNSFASGDGTQTGDPFWQWHPGVRRTNELVLTGRFNADANTDLAVFSRGERSGADFASTFVTLCAGQARPEPESRLTDFGYGTLGTDSGYWSQQKPLASRPANEVRPLLVVLSECSGNTLSRTVAQFDAAFFGPSHPNIASWYQEMSDGKLTFSRAATVKIGPFACPLPDATSVRTQMEAAADADGSGGFEFKNFDLNSDGIVDASELALCVVSTYDNGGRGWGQSWPIDVTVFPGTGRQVRLLLRWAGVGDQSSLDNFAHELGHCTLGIQDLYGSNCRGFGLTLASCTGGATSTTLLRHLDPWHKMRLGWIAPLIYDLKDFPAGASVAPPQATAERPVLLYDSTRGTNEFYLIEHRNGLRTNGTQTFTASGGIWRAPLQSSYPASGYDQGLFDTAGTRRGFVTWAVKTDNNHTVLDIPQRILAGANGVINSTRVGDDILWTDPLNPNNPQIHCGPDGILNSIAAGDDAYAQDALCLPVIAPAEMLSRETNTLNPGGDIGSTLKWFNSVDTGVRVRGDAINGNTWQFLEWGQNFRPFIETFSASSPSKPGDLFIALGSLGRLARYQARLISPNNDVVPVTVTSWTGAGATFKIPTNSVTGSVGGPRSGRYRFVIFDSSTNQASSNVFPLDIINACEDWRAANFTAAELANPTISGDGADPDGDRQSNLEEFLMGTNPRSSNPSGLTPIFLPGQAGFSFNARGDRGCVRVTLQYCGDLSGDYWVEGEHMDFAGTDLLGSTVSGYLLSPPTPFPATFVRLKFQRY